MTVYLGTRRTVMLNSYDAVREAFGKMSHVFSGRPQDLFYITELTKGLGQCQGSVGRGVGVRNFRISRAGVGVRGLRSGVQASRLVLHHQTHQGARSVSVVMGLGHGVRGPEVGNRGDPG